MKYDQESAAAMMPLAAAEHAHMASGLLQFLRDVAEAMDQEAEKGEAVDAGLIGGWVKQLDFLGNTLSNATDEFADVIRSAGGNAPLSAGTMVLRY